MAIYKRPREVRKPKREVSSKTRLQELWESRIEEAERVKDDWKERFQVDALEGAYYGNQKPEWWEDDGWFTINLLFSAFRVMERNVVPKALMIRARLARTYRADPQAVMQFQAQAELRQAVLQYLFNNLKVYEAAREAYLNSRWQFGMLKIGYSATMEKNENAGLPMIGQDNQIIFEEDGTVKEEPEQKVSEEAFFVDSIDPECFLVDKYCGSVIDRTGSWVAHKIFKTVDEVKRDSLYKNTRNIEASALTDSERKYLKEEKYLRPHSLAKRADLLDLEDSYVVLYELYDLKRKETLTIARDHDIPLIMPKEIPPGCKPHPFVPLVFHKRRNSFYPIPTFYNLMGPQLEYNIRRNLSAVHIKRFNRKYAVDENVAEDQVMALKTGADGTVLRVPPGSIQPIDDAPLTGENLTDTQLLKAEFDEMSQVGKLQRGQLGADSATEAEIAERRGREGETDEHQTVMTALEEAAIKLHKCVEENITQEGAVSVLGPAGEQWFYFGPEDFDPIEGEFLFEIKTDATQQDTVSVERAQTLQFVDIVMKNPWLVLSPALTRALMNQFPSLANNEVLISELQRLGALMIGAGGNQGQGTGASQGRVPTRQQDIDQQSRKVVSR